MMGKGRVFAASAALVMVAVLAAVRVSGASADMGPRLTDKSCEDPSEDVTSPDRRFVARYTKEACDYGLGSNSQDAWIDVIDAQGSTNPKIQILQLSGPLDDLDIVRWRDNTHLEVDTSWPLSIKRSLHKAGPVTVIYVASAPRSFLNHGADYAHFVHWAKENAAGGAVSSKSPCSQYEGAILRQAC